MSTSNLQTVNFQRGQYIMYCRKFSVLLSQPQTPNLEEDINEVILRDVGIDLAVQLPAVPERRRKAVVTVLFSHMRSFVGFYVSLLESQMHFS